MELAFANARSAPAWLALRRPILPTSPFWPLGSEEARLRAGLRPPPNCPYPFRVGSFHEDSAMPGCERRN
jgi:hypothetical protein